MSQVILQLFRYVNVCIVKLNRNNKGWKNKKNCEHIADIFKVMAHRDRIAIFSFMNNCKQCTCRVKDIYEKLNLPQPVVSRHLGLMKRQRIVNRIFKRKETHYTLNISEKIVRCIQSCFI